MANVPRGTILKGYVMKTATIEKYTIWGTTQKVYSIVYRGKYIKSIPVIEQLSLQNIIQYALNMGFTQIKFKGF